MVLLLVMALFLAVALQSVAAGAQSEFAGGSGTEGDPYLVENAEQLNSMRNHLSAHFRLVADIMLLEYLSAGFGGYHDGARCRLAAYRHRGGPLHREVSR